MEPLFRAQNIVGLTFNVALFAVGWKKLALFGLVANVGDMIGRQASSEYRQIVTGENRRGFFDDAPAITSVQRASDAASGATV